MTYAQAFRWAVQILTSQFQSGGISEGPIPRYCGFCHNTRARQNRWIKCVVRNYVCLELRSGVKQFQITILDMRTYPQTIRIELG